MNDADGRALLFRRAAIGTEITIKRTFKSRRLGINKLVRCIFRMCVHGWRFRQLIYFYLILFVFSII